MGERNHDSGESHLEGCVSRNIRVHTARRVRTAIAVERPARPLRELVALLVTAIVLGLLQAGAFSHAVSLLEERLATKRSAPHPSPPAEVSGPQSAVRATADSRSRAQLEVVLAAVASASKSIAALEDDASFATPERARQALPPSPFVSAERLPRDVSAPASDRARAVDAILGPREPSRYQYLY